MILKKPYAFFIKIFKPMHLLLFSVVLYLIYISNNVLKFLNSHMYSPEIVVEKSLIQTLIKDSFYAIPIIVMVLFLVLLTVMYKKNKPIVFYFVGIFSFLVVLVINVYSLNFLNILSEHIVSVKSIKLIHDLVLINMIIESIIVVVLFIRGVGLDFKKFDFSSDILRFDVSDSDREEFELNVNIDFAERKRKRKEKYRKIKYVYIENKLIINIFIILFLIVVFGTVGYVINKNSVKNKEGVFYSMENFSFKVNNTTLLNTDFRNNKITNNYLIIINATINPNYDQQVLYLNDFSLNIGEQVFKPVKKYFDKLKDLGEFYDDTPIPSGGKTYLFVYEIPEKLILDDMSFRYISEGKSIDIQLSPVKFSKKEQFLVNANIKEELIFEGDLNGVKIKVEDFEINEKFVIKYNYCISKDDCILSKEYLIPSLDENYDKVVLKLKLDYEKGEKKETSTFYDFLNNYGGIEYKIEDAWYGIYKFENIKSNRVLIEDYVYLGINSNILNAESIKFVFGFQNKKYNYILK